jgi:predicted MFS family arabinose efflux permease
MNQPLQKNPMDAATVVTAALIVSAIGALFYNVLPLYLGAAQDYRGLDNKAIGFLSAAFFLGYNVVTISAFFWIRRVSWARVVAISTPISVVSLYAGAAVNGYMLLLLFTVIAGGAFAALYGIGTTILGDTSNPARWYGVKIAAEAFPGVILLLVLPGTAIARWGFDGAVAGVIVFVILLSPFLFWIPAHGRKGVHDEIPAESADGKQSPFIWMTLLATLLFFGSASALWAFIERIGAHNNFDPQGLGVLLSVTLVFAVIGSLTAAALGGRCGNIKPFLAGGLVYVAGVVLLADPGSFDIYAAGACLLTAGIGYMLPIAITEIADLDADGRYIILSVPAIGIGAMTGPAIAGVLTQDGSFLPLIVFGASTVLLSMILITIAGSRARTTATANPVVE